MEVLFTLIKSKDNINGIELYDYSFLISAYADYSTFLLKYIVSVRILGDTFKVFSCFFGLKPNNNNKREIAGLGILKGAQEEACGLKNIDLSNDTIKILGIHFSYNKEIQTERNYLTLTWLGFSNEGSFFWGGRISLTLRLHISRKMNLKSI